MEGRAGTIFENLEKGVQQSDESLQSTSLNQVREVFEEIESKYSMSRASLVGVQSVICNALLKHHGFDMAQEIKEDIDGKPLRWMRCGCFSIDGKYIAVGGSVKEGSDMCAYLYGSVIIWEATKGEISEFNLTEQNWASVSLS